MVNQTYVDMFEIVTKVKSIRSNNLNLKYILSAEVDVEAKR